MNYSVIALGLGIATWGWLNQVWFLAGILVALVLLNPLTSWRWDLNQAQFHRIADASVGLVILVLTYGYLVNSDTNPVYSILKWLPVLLAPVLLTQIYSLRNKLPISALFYSLRGSDDSGQKEIDFSLPYTLVTVLAAGAGNVQSAVYFAMTAAIVGMIIFIKLPGHGNKITCVLIFSSAMAVSHFSHLELKRLHAYVQEKSIDFFSDWSTDPFKSSTSIGKIGELKLSDKIEFHVIADNPMLLHQSSYNFYADHAWHATDTVFEPYHNKLTANVNNRKNLEIVQTFGTDLILALPDGMVAIGGLEGARIERTELGAFKISDPPEWARYQVDYSGVRQSTVTPVDLHIPDQHKHWLRQVSKKLGLKQKPPEQIASIIKQYFQNQFFYTLYTPTQSSPDRALVDFVLERQAGHCEYFAAATVFLLRYSGVPARLANGYAVQEYDPALGMYIVRRRHSHAWAIASIGGNWRAIDTTPSRWLEIEAENAGKLQAISDWFYTAYFRFSEWRVRVRIIGFEFGLAMVLVVMLGYMGLSLYKGKRRGNSAKSPEGNDVFNKDRLGSDSEFFEVEHYFEQRGQARNDSESIVKWAKRLPDSDLENIVQLHYRYRFDPLGLSKSQRKNLRSSVENWFGKN